MKIAIQGHPTRGKEVIQILESLGGINMERLTGTYKTFYYINHRNKISDTFKAYLPSTHECYTLEEFEKEFPFKIGDKVIVFNYNNEKGTILNITSCGPVLCYYIKLESGTGIYRFSKQFKRDEEMNTRNITLTLDKAKEWYNKGGELKEIALQAFTKEELNPLPKSWEEYCKMYPMQAAQCISVAGCPKKYIALWKLEQLRDCYRQGWKPDWTDHSKIKYGIRVCRNSIHDYDSTTWGTTFTFPTEEMRDAFYENFKNEIEQCKELL